MASEAISPEELSFGAALAELEQIVRALEGGQLEFDDVAPQAPVHTLIIPRTHYSDLADNVPPEILTALMQAVPRVAEAKGVRDSGYRTIINTGPDAGQTVHHLHVHVMGGRRMAEGMLTFAAQE